MLAILNEGDNAPIEMSHGQAFAVLEKILCSSTSNKVDPIIEVFQHVDLPEQLVSPLLLMAKANVDQAIKFGVCGEYELVTNNEGLLRRIGAQMEMRHGSQVTVRIPDTRKWHGLDHRNYALAQIHGATFSPETGLVTLTAYGPRRDNAVIETLIAHQQKVYKRPDVTQRYVSQQLQMDFTFPAENNFHDKLGLYRYAAREETGPRQLRLPLLTVVAGDFSKRPGRTVESPAPAVVNL